MLIGEQIVSRKLTFMLYQMLLQMIRINPVLNVAVMYLPPSLKVVTGDSFTLCANDTKLSFVKPQRRYGMPTESV